MFEYMRARESANPVFPYLQNQPEITVKMRKIIVDWLVEVTYLFLRLKIAFFYKFYQYQIKLQEAFQLTHESLFLAVTLIDRYLSKQNIKKDEFQLVGATALFLASKLYVSPLFCSNHFDK